MGVGAKLHIARNQLIFLGGSVYRQHGAAQSDAIGAAKLYQQWFCSLGTLLHAGEDRRLRLYHDTISYFQRCMGTNWFP